MRTIIDKFMAGFDAVAADAGVEAVRGIGTDPTRGTIWFQEPDNAAMGPVLLGTTLVVGYEFDSGGVRISISGFSLDDAEERFIENLIRGDGFEVVHAGRGSEALGDRSRKVQTRCEYEDSGHAWAIFAAITKLLNATQVG